MENIKEVEIEGKKIYLKESFNGWKIVYPIKNADGSINWKHLIAGGSWTNLFLVALFVAVMVGFFFEYNHNLKMCSELMNKANLNPLRFVP